MQICVTTTFNFITLYIVELSAVRSRKPIRTDKAINETINPVSIHGWNGIDRNSNEDESKQIHRK